MDHAAPSLLAAPPPPSTTPILTLADVVTVLRADQLLSLARKRELISAVHSLARLLDLDPAAVPAEPRGLRNRLATLSPAAGGIGRGRWNNIRSLTLTALRQAGVRTMRGRASAPLNPAWEALRAQLPDAKARLGLSRFMSHCSAQGIRPEAVTAATFADFLAGMESESLVRRPQAVHRASIALWNCAAADIPGWPQIVVAATTSDRLYSLDWAAFPAGFRADMEAFLAHSGDRDPFADDYAPSVAPGTVKMRRKQIHQLASALVLSGVPAERIAGLADLVRPAHAKAALQFLLKRHRDGKRTSPYLHQQAQLLKTIARHWVKAPAADIAELAVFCRRLAPKRSGMTEKNRTRLRQFDTPANVPALLNLPRSTLREVRAAATQGVGEARLAMLAAAVELLIVAPMRIDNLVGLEERHFVRIRAGGQEAVHLVIPAAETKTKAPYEVHLPAETVAVLDAYRAEFRPLLCAEPSPWLFPNPAGQRRNTIAFAQAVQRFIGRRTGLTMNVHLFRHFAGKVYLEHSPDDVETVRRLLGHRSQATTLRAYTELKSTAAFRRFDAVIENWREQAATPTPPRRRKTENRP